MAQGWNEDHTVVGFMSVRCALNFFPSFLLSSMKHLQYFFELFKITVPQQTCCFVDIRMFLVAKSLWTNRFFSRYIIPHAIWAAHSLRSFWEISDWWSIKRSSRAPIWTNSWTWNSIFHNIWRESQNLLYWYSTELCQSYLLYLLS